MALPNLSNVLATGQRLGIVMVFLFSFPVLDPTIVTLMAATWGADITRNVTTITFQLLMPYRCFKLSMYLYQPLLNIPTLVVQ
ncbi:hypothetical protein YV30_23800 [Salmonella enterica subsp. enterica]|nr:hypothetical protein [Salmonella enterica subsp. enterica serovar Typhi]ECH9276473.1 hypothetical protein [Salmonella enterica subsp. enterica]